MGRPRKTGNDYRKEIFNQEYRVYKALLQQTDADVAECLGISGRTLTERKKNPWEFRVDEICQIMATWSEPAILAFVRGKKLDRT